MGSDELTTGWEPALPAEDTLVRQAVLVHASWTTTAATAAGRPLHRDDDVCAAVMSERAAFENAAVRLRPGEVTRVLDTLGAFYPPAVPFSLISPWPTEDLRPWGLQLIGHPPLMARFPGTGDPPAGLPPVREVVDAAGLVDFARVQREGFPMPDLDEGAFPPGLLGGAARFWLADDGDGPAAAGAAHVDAGVCLVVMVATLAAARGRGLGSAVTWAATLAAPDLPAVLLASDDGRPVYERMGYRALERWTLWLRPPAG